MALGGEPASPWPRTAEPELEVRWRDGWEQFQEALRALQTPLPLGPSQGALVAWRTPLLLERSWPKRALAASLVLHGLFVVMPLPAFLTRAPAPPAALAQVRIEYDLSWAGGSKLLPPIAPARQLRAARRPSPPGPKDQPSPRPGADAVLPQTIVSRPAEPNHPRQTLLTEFSLDKSRVVRHNLGLPNMVIPPAAPAAPTPQVDLRRLRGPGTLLDPNGTLRAALPPPPKSKGELALAETRLENLYPKLAVEPGSTAPGRDAAPQVRAPSGPVGSGDLAALGVIALSPQPGLPSAVLELPETNLRARFAAGPETGSGSPLGLTGGSGWGGEAGGSGGLGAADILVTAAGPAPSGPVIVGDRLPAEPPPPALEQPAAPEAAIPASSHSAPQASQPVHRRAEEMLEGRRPGTPVGAGAGPRVYTMTVNMPNLTSQSGSWVLRFAELGEARSTAPGGAANGFPLAPPVAVKKVDPRYPAEARRARIEGSVFLYGVIREDGTVGNVQVVRSLHELLDQNAVEAFTRWHFQPGRKNGAAVPLEVVVEIPFRASKLF